MSTPRLDRHPDHVRSGKSIAEQVKLHNNPYPQVEDGEQQNHRNERLAYVMAHFCNWEHGYLKVKRDSSGSDLHLTWTWTLSHAAGSYVYVRCNFWELDFGLDMLSRKILEVDEGTRKPTPDKRNPSH